MTGRPPVRLLGVRVDAVTMDEAVERVRTLIRGDASGYIVTLNAAMLGRAARDPRFHALVGAAALVTADGMGTLLVGRIVGTPVPERVAGVDLAGRLCAMCAREGFRVFLLGAAPGVAEAAAARLQARHPELIIAGTQHGYFDADRDEAIAGAVRAAEAHLLLVALGSPRQEEWLARWLRPSGARAGVGVGGTLDVLAGRTRLAPAWIRNLGLEWVYRLAREPRRWRVAAGLPQVILLALKERVRGGSIRRSRG